MSPAEMLAEFPAALGDEPGRGNAQLRWKLQEEGHKELVDELTEERAAISGRIRVPKDDAAVDREHLARELADVVYLAYGTAHAFDIDLEVALAEIHRAAMSKLGPGMRVRDDGKVLKPEGFVPPDMKAAVERERAA